jgi:hypothetical protein
MEHHQARIFPTSGCCDYLIKLITHTPTTAVTPEVARAIGHTVSTGSREGTLLIRT